MLSQMAKFVKSLKKIDLEITNNIKAIKKSIVTAIDNFPPKYYRSQFTNKICFIIYMFFNKFMKYQNLRFSHLYHAQKLITEFNNLISEYISNQVPIQVKYQEFLSFSIEKVDTSILKLEFKLKSLFTYIKNLPEVNNNFTILSNKSLLNEMKKLIPETDVQNDYIHPNYFDLLLESYIESDQELFRHFLQIINIHDTPPTKELNYNSKYTIPNYLVFSNSQRSDLILNDFCFFMNMLLNKLKSNSNSIIKLDFNDVNYTNNSETNHDNKENKKIFDFEKFECLIQKVYSKITSSNTIKYQMYVILRCASIRFLCNQYYIRYHHEWLEKLDNRYIQNCVEIVNDTPYDLQISKEIVPANLYNEKLTTILLNDDFKEAIKLMCSIQFFNCPIDIWTELNKSIDLAMKGARNLKSDEPFDPNLPFDDFFSIILGVFASAQILCPSTLHSFLSLFKRIKKPVSMDIMAVSAMALLGYLRNQVL